MSAALALAGAASLLGGAGAVVGMVVPQEKPAVVWCYSTPTPSPTPVVELGEDDIVLVCRGDGSVGHYVIGRTYPWLR